MIRLSIETPDRAQQVVQDLCRDMGHRVAANPPGLCPVDLALNFLRLCHAQTCGKCVPCRIGLSQLETLIESVLDQTAPEGTIDLIESTAAAIADSADCAIGYEAAAMVLEGVRGFREDYELHAKEGRCICSLKQPVPCVTVCPAHVDIPGYIALVREGRFQDAVDLIRKDNPFPYSCAYVCEHPCEKQCRRRLVDDAINICGIKRYAVDHCGDEAPPAPAEATGKRIAVVGAEPYTAAFRQRIEDLFNMKVYNSYGLSEMNGPGVAFECQEQNGLHIWEDAYFAEIVDPETGRHVAPGEVGELVMTTLVREGMPILRYRTRDLTRFLPGTCPCGRLHHRMDRILGRSDDMFICKGVNIYPQQIEDVLMKFPEVGRNYLILLDNDNVGDILRVQVEIREEYFVEDLRVLRGLQNRIAHALRSEILVTPRIELVQSNSLPVSDGKAVRFKDQRNSK